MNPASKYFSVIEYGNNTGQTIANVNKRMFGRKCSQLCDELGIKVMRKTSKGRMYPLIVLNQAYSDIKSKQVKTKPELYDYILFKKESNYDKLYGTFSTGKVLKIDIAEKYYIVDADYGLDIIKFSELKYLSQPHF